MGMRTLHGCVVFLLLTASLLSQKTQLVPKSMIGIEGGSKTSIPFGWSSPNRYMAIYEADELPWTGPKLISGLRFRADWNGGVATPAKQYLSLELWMSTSTVDTSSVSKTFGENHGNDRTMVFDRVPVSLPAQAQMPSTATAPRPCDVAFPLSTPWYYGLTPSVTADQNPRTLVLEIRTYQTVKGAYFMDNPTGCSIPTSNFGKQDPLCLTSLKSPLTIASSSSIMAGSHIEYRITGLEPAYPALVLVGLSSTGTMFGKPVPVALDTIAALANPNPGNPITAPDCFVNVEPVLSIPVTIRSSTPPILGTARLTLPGNRALVGQSFFAQAISNDLAANNFQFTTSLGLKTTVCGPAGVTRIIELNSATAVTGSTNTGSALIFEVY